MTRADTAGKATGTIVVPVVTLGEMAMDPIGRCEGCDKPLHEGDDYHFDTEGLVYICSACVEVEEIRLREEFGWIGAGRGDTSGKGVPHDTASICEHGS